VKEPISSRDKLTKSQIFFFIYKKKGCKTISLISFYFSFSRDYLKYPLQKLFQSIAFFHSGLIAIFTTAGLRFFQSIKGDSLLSLYLFSSSCNSSIITIFSFNLNHIFGQIA
jgi:hypothetical protein